MSRLRALSQNIRRMQAAGPRLAVIVVLLVLPWLLNSFRVSLLTEVLIFGLLAASLDLLVGYTGLASLGHATYFGVGGYATALVARDLTDNALAGLVVAVVVSVIVAVVTGWLAVRTRGVYFLMLTLAFAQLLFSLAVTWEPVTGGSNGLSVPTSTLPGLRLTGVTLYYYTLVVTGLAYVALRAVTRSPFGHSLVAIRENEARARSVGYSTFGYKLAAYTLAGAFGGLAGGLFTQFNRFIAPSNVAFEISALVLIMVIVGGRGTLYGPVIGAGVLLLVREELSARFEHFELALGLIFVAFVYFLPRGLAGLARRRDGPPPRVARPDAVPATAGAEG